MYKLTVIWENGNKDVHYYETKEKAEKVAAGFETAFGNQIFYIYVMKV